MAGMDYAVDKDHEAIQGAGREPAMNRFHLIPRLSTLLKRKGVQLWFLQLSGCSVLERWLKLNPDGSFPPQQVVE